MPYPTSIDFDHRFNGIAVSPDGKTLFVNSGARTDHGEVEDNHGLFPGVREMPLTALILRLPANGADILLQNDDAALRAGGYVVARGLRNTFDLAISADGELFGGDNSGDRDDADELNWIQEGRHYGFPSASSSIRATSCRTGSGVLRSYSDGRRASLRAMVPRDRFSMPART